MVEDAGIWRCAAAAPSYDAFVALAEGHMTNWAQKAFPGTTPNVSCLLQAAEVLAASPIDVVALDMPIATTPFTSRREADSATSREFGSRGCATHSPSATRPGALGAQLSSNFIAAGFEMATTTHSPAGPTLMEVYPHPALLSLLKREYRVPYKASKSLRYWPALDASGRIEALCRELEAIYAALAMQLGPLPFELPQWHAIATLSTLKRYEDALDALVCAWVGVEYLKGRAIPLGDPTAAIWCPADVVQSPPS